MDCVSRQFFPVLQSARRHCLEPALTSHELSGRRIFYFDSQGPSISLPRRYVSKYVALTRSPLPGMASGLGCGFRCRCDSLRYSLPHTYRTELKEPQAAPLIHLTEPLVPETIAQAGIMDASAGEKGTIATETSYHASAEVAGSPWPQQNRGRMWSRKQEATKLGLPATSRRQSTAVTP